MNIKKYYREGFNHLKSDPVMDFLIKKFEKEIDITDRFNKNYSKAIADLIIEQQILWNLYILDQIVVALVLSK